MGDLGRVLFRRERNRWLPLLSVFVAALVTLGGIAAIAFKWVDPGNETPAIVVSCAGLVIGGIAFYAFVYETGSITAFEHGMIAEQGKRRYTIPYEKIQEMAFSPYLPNDLVLTFTIPGVQNPFHLHARPHSSNPSQADLCRLYDILVASITSKFLARIDSGETVTWTAHWRLRHRGLVVNGELLEWEQIQSYDDSTVGTFRIFVRGELMAMTQRTNQMNFWPGCAVFLMLSKTPRLAARN